MLRPGPRFGISVEFNGKPYGGTYSIDSGVVTLNSIYGRRSAPIRRSSPHAVARLLFFEILQGARPRREI